MRLRRATLITGFCAALLTGLWLGRDGQALSILVALAVPMLIVGRHSLLTFGGLILLGLGLGTLRGYHVARAAAEYASMKQVTLRVEATEDAVYGKKQQLTFVATGVMYNGHALPGKLSVSGFGQNTIMQNDTVWVTGSFRQGMGGYEGFMSYAQLHVVAHHPSLVADIRRQFAAGMQTALPEPLASFSMGLLIGQRATLPDDIKQNLLMVGLTHIIAVSGYNLTIMLEASRKLLARQSKHLSFGLSLSLMALFVLLAGASPSIIRAAIVSTLSLAAAYYGRRISPLALIGIAAAVTAYANPLYLWGDPSWYLSFLAFFGVLLVSPLLQERLPPAFQNSTVLAVGLESICAEIMSLPYVLFTFGQMSLINLPANMLVVTFVPLAMLLGLIAGLAGMVLPVWCGWFAWPAKLLLTYMLQVAQWLAGLPHIFREQVWLSLRQMLGVYGLIAGMTAALHFKDRSQNATMNTNERT